MEMTESRTPPRPYSVSGAVGRYHAAKARLLAARQEKTEAADDFLAARAALRGNLRVPQPMFVRAKEFGPSDTPEAWAGA